MSRGNAELVEVFRGRALNVNSITRFSGADDFPLGEGWHALLLRFNLALVNSTGTTAITDGELGVINGITLKTSRGEFPVNGVPAFPLYRFAQIKSGTLPRRDAIAVTTGTYRVEIPIYFTDPLMNVGEDTILDTSRYSAINLEISLGGVANLMSVVGDSVLTPTLDAYVLRTRGKVPDKIKPAMAVEYGIRPQAAPASVTEILLERAANLTYKRLLVHAANSVTAGVPFSGTEADSIISQLTLDHDGGRPYENVLVNVLADLNKLWYAMETVLVGQYWIDFCLDGSTMAALFSGDKSRLSVKWINDTLSTSGISLAYEGLRPLR